MGFDDSSDRRSGKKKSSGLVGRLANVSVTGGTPKTAIKHGFMSELGACQVIDVHLNRNKIESNLSVPGFQGRHENTPIKSLETSPHWICLWPSIKIPLGPASGSGLENGWP